MRRGCEKTKPATPRGRARNCYYVWPAPCSLKRTRSRFTPPLCFDPCLGARARRREPAGHLPGC
jgi:hypothetical protein